MQEALQALATQLGLEIRIAHYPPYCSKHNPIEHRLFPHITRACQGVAFHSLTIAKQFMEQARTSTGLKVAVDVLEGVYETGKNVQRISSKTSGSLSMSICLVGIIGRFRKQSFREVIFDEILSSLRSGSRPPKPSPRRGL